MSPHPRPHPRTRSARNRRPWLEPLEDRLVLSTIAALVDPSPLPVNRIETFDSASPGTLATSALVSNLQSGDQLSTIAFRPDTSQLYGLSAKHLYTVDLTSGQATLVGDFSIGLDPGDNSLFSSFKIFSSFDPFADAIREITVIETAGAAPVYHSRLINPFDASIMDDAIVNLQYVTGDVNQGNAAPVLRGFAYTNQVVDASFTRLYAVDSANNFLATLGGSSGKHPTPDNGQLASVGPLADVDALTVGGPADDAFALGRFDPVTQTETLLTVDLATGGTNSAGTIGGTGNIQALAVVPSNPPPFTLVQFGQADYHFSQAAGAAIVYVTRIGDTRTDLVVAYETIDGTAQAGTDYRSTADVLTLHAGEIARAIVLPLLYDGVPEPDENFSVMLGIPGGGAVLGTPSVAVVTLSDPQPLRLQMDVATVGPASPAHAIDVLANDTDAPGRTGPLTVVAVTQGDHGGLVSIAADHGPVLYTPAADFTGLDHFQYTARDDFGDRSTADVVVLVLQAATPPTAQDDSLTVIHDSGPTPLDVLANDRNAPGTVGALVITDVANGVQGDQVIITGGGAGISYRPPPGFFGTDTFTYTIRDSNNASATATVTVAVRPNNSIQGQVFNDLNGNGVHEPGEPGVDGWTIQLLDRNHSVIDSQVTHALDLNGDGTIDPETERGLYRFDDLNADNYAIVEVPQAGWVQTQPGQVSFGNVNTLTLPGSVATIAAGKFTSSSGLALLTTFSSPTNGQVNSGIAVFLPAVGGGNIPVISHFNMFGLRTASAVAADFNGDGVPDLALTAGNELDVILSQGYDFPLGFRSSTGNGAAAIVAADFNGDGHIDLAIADHDDNQVELFFNDGHGTFSPGGVMPTDRGPIALAAADFDGDGLPDLAVANQTDNTVTLFHNGPGGHFLSADTLAVGADPVAIQAAFLNGDSLPDLAVVNHDSGTVSVFLNAGQGRFLPRLDVPVGTGPLSLVAGDFNGDGSTDLVVGEGARLVVMRNSGDGHFATNTSALGFQADDIVAGDFNGDGVSDLAMASGAIVFVFESARTSEISVSFVNQAGQAVQGQDFGDFRNAVVPVLPRDTRTFGQRLTDMLYSTVFARNADAAGRALWSSQLDAGTSLAQVALDFLDSPEYHAREVDDAYQKLLGRKPDSVGRAAFAADLSQGAGIDQIEAIIAGSPEYFRRAGGTDALFVAALYRDVLGRKPDEKGAALWEGMLAKG
ncbi:MAG TPA: FG-GAP-like repeat-containing protein, partial [Gemmataceae bacterium]|nr:FG-GAP-like repeat-containing protein [Gemmataceae bacterium]